MGPPRGRGAFAVRRLVLTAVAVGVCFSVWKENKRISSRHSVDQSLVGRHLLVAEDIPPVDSPTPTAIANHHSTNGRKAAKAPTEGNSDDDAESVVSSIQNKEITTVASSADAESKGRTSGLDAKVGQKTSLSENHSNKEVTQPAPTDRQKSHEESSSRSASAEEVSNAKYATEKSTEENSARENGDTAGAEGEKESAGKEEGNSSGKGGAGSKKHSPTTSNPKKETIGPVVLHKPGIKMAPTTSTATSGKGNKSAVTAVQWEDRCTPPAYHEFPPDLFTHSQRAHGAVIVHIAVIVYMFYAVAVVCDDYFVASLEECCSRLDLSEDVAGATFMAAGSSAPELFTAILGVLVAKGDVGTGTIVGSAVFNVLFVIGLCGIFSGRIVELTWWPLFRDSIFYSATVIILIAIIFDSRVTWYESVIMMAIYAVYIILMKFNNDVHFWVARRLGIEDGAPQNTCILAQGDKKNYSSYVPFNNEIDECASVPVTAHFSYKTVAADESIRKSSRIMSMHEAALVIMMSRHFRPKTRFRSAACRVIYEQRRLRREAGKIQGQVSIDSQDASRKKGKMSTSMGLTSESNWKSLPTREEGWCRLFKWLLQAPLLAVLHCSIPDCRKERWKRFFILTFVASITWTAIFSYVMVWMVTLAGYTLGIPDSIMGITFLAAGTSVPDAMASLIVSRQGQGDMAVSNSLGSNIFDILIGLALPWFIQTTIIAPGSIAVINSRGMVYSVILLFLTIIITIGGIFLSHWQLTKRLGIVLLSVYAIFLLISILLEFNFLGYVNPPMCQD